ncbi:unnamed protein product [Ixodes persulcatus]
MRIMAESGDTGTLSASRLLMLLGGFVMHLARRRAASSLIGWSSCLCARVIIMTCLFSNRMQPPMALLTIRNACCNLHGSRRRFLFLWCSTSSCGNALHTPVMHIRKLQIARACRSPT